MVIQPIVSTFTGGAALDAQGHAVDKANNSLTAASNQAIGYQQPYMDLGNKAVSSLSDNLNSLTSPITMNQSQLEQTPGYQFNLYQGQKAVQNSAAARGLGTSGAALKGAAGYATGLADSTYQNQFANAQTNQANQFNRLMGLSEFGQGASTAAGNAALRTASQISGNDVGLGNAQAAYYNGIGSSVNNSLNTGWGIAGGTGNLNNLMGPSNSFNYGNLGSNTNAPYENINWNSA